MNIKEYVKMAEQKNKIFNQHALDKINSPEQLNDYLKVTNPGIWVILAAVITLLIGFIAWASLGKLETTVNAMADVAGGTASVWTTENTPVPISAGMKVRIGSEEYSIASMGRDDNGKAVAHIPVQLLDGYYEAKIVVESVSPVTFLCK